MNNNITLIPARNKYRSGQIEDKNKLRVAAYCRVSTETEEQSASYEAQIDHYTNYIGNHPEWKLAGIFADEGISGTDTKKRDEFNRMIDECVAGKIDMVITKSISRFARNTLDCLKYIRKLKEFNVAIYFEKENINTLDAKGEVMITIMASLAQQESQSLSQNIKMGIQYRFQQGEVMVNCNRFLGYNKVDKKLVIDPEQAETVKRIFRECLEGKGCRQIANGLEADGVKNGAGNSKWHIANINKILKNEKYVGDALLQKTYTVDFLTKKRVKNTGIMPQYYVENSHEAIIPRDVFLRVQRELEKRRVGHTSPNGKHRTYSSKHCLANKVFCSECGEIYRRLHWNNKGKRSIVWRCCSMLQKTGVACNVRTVWEPELLDAVVKAIKQILGNKAEFLKTLEENIKKVICNNNRVEEIDRELGELQTQLVQKASSKQDYEVVAEQIHQLREKRDKAILDKVDQDEQRYRIEETIAFLHSHEANGVEYDERLVYLLIEKVTVYDAKFLIEFKSGVQVKIAE
ncbi:MAG: recombinase family protein [Bacteroidales bacterium]|nr:recombinase family protein [Bacteroidales bacterium]